MDSDQRSHVRQTSASFPIAVVAESTSQEICQRRKSPRWSFDHDVGKQNFNFYKTLFADGELKNPNECNATATFFVSHEYTEYQIVEELYHNRHDIADHTISHRTPASWWKSAN